MMDTAKIIERYVDDRDRVSDEELAVLVEALRDSPELARQLKEQLLLNELLSQRYAIDRQEFDAQVDQRLRDFEVGEVRLADQVDGIRRLAETELTEWKYRDKRSRAIRFFAALSVLLVIAISVGIWFALNISTRNIAIVDEVSGSAKLTRDDQPRELNPGVKVYVGDRFDTAAGQKVTLRYPDGTVVKIGSESSVVLPRFRPHGGKYVAVQRGDVLAKVAPQENERPMVFTTPTAEATVLGTELTLSVRDGITWLDVTEGRVELLRKRNEAKVIVAAAHHGVATDERLDVGPNVWPTRRDGLSFVFDTRDELNLVHDPLIAVSRRCEVSPFDAASFDDHGAMRFEGGWFAAHNTDVSLFAACKKSNELTIQSVIQPASLDQQGPARIITFSSAEQNHNFLLAQRGDRLIARLRTAGKESREEVDLCGLSLGETNHVVVAYRPGQLVCYLNGEKVYETDEVRGDFSNWSGQYLTFGGEHDGGFAWQGLLAGVGIYHRFLDSDEAARNAEVYTELRNSRLRMRVANSFNRQ